MVISILAPWFGSCQKMICLTVRRSIYLGTSFSQFYCMDSFNQIQCVIVSSKYIVSHTISISMWHMSCAMRKLVFGHMRIAMVEFSLRIHTILWRSSLSANRFTGYNSMYEWRVKAQMILCACAGWSARFWHVRRHFSLDAAQLW